MKHNAKMDNISDLKGRGREIFLELCAEIDCLPYGSPLPSIRELRRRYGAGQQTITRVLKHLGEYRNLKSSPRRRTYLADPTATMFSSFQKSEAIMTGRHAARCTTLGMLSLLRGRWEKYIVEYNRLHRHNIAIRYADTPEELASFAANTDVDFILFYAKPVAIDLLANTADFIDLRSLCSELDMASYYPGVFMNDPDRRIWGISPAKVLPVISCHRRYCPEYPEGLGWEEFDAELRRLKHKFPALDYPGYIDGYMIYLFNHGIRLIDPATHELRLNYEELEGPLYQLRESTREKLFPLFSDAHYQGIGRSRFFKGRIGMAQFLCSPMPHDPGFQEIPMPLSPGAKVYCGSESFHICMHSLHYKNAWDFIKYILSYDVQRRLIRGDCPLSARRDLVPEYLTESKFEIFRRSLEQEDCFLEDYFFPIHLRMILEAGIDRWIEFGKDLKPTLCDIERTCRQHMKNSNNNIQTEVLQK